ncbi:cyclin-like protein [Catenaria anguillulae PL171]|uniref:Cyclin-like protein n=1 Tax=Catenaria anguillulae PL171 TaxID=765915 RepID=A0A1Y2HR93_9FUNG|nr:cyclin-like protein [Catenaria anguillulae PL171]
MTAPKSSTAAAGGLLPDHPSSAATAQQEEDTVPALFELTSQFRHWRFSKSDLAAIRKETNAAAIANARKTLAIEAQLQGQDDTFDADSIDFFTVDEELEWVNLCCSLPPMLCKVLELSPLVQATAIAFIKRFYLFKSVIDYEIKAVMTTCIFLASKVENNRVDLSKLLARIKGMDPSYIKDLEFTIADVLQYEFWIRHPFDAALGIYLDYQSTLAPQIDISTQLLDDTWKQARVYITKSIATDATLLYMPAQVAMGCWLAAARKTGLPFETEFVGAKLMGVLEDVIALLASAAEPVGERRAKLAEKRRLCCNPELNPETKLFMVRSDERKRKEVVEEEQPQGQASRPAAAEDRKVDVKALRAMADELDKEAAPGAGAENRKRKADDGDTEQGAVKRAKTEPGTVGSSTSASASSSKVKQEPQ